MEAALASAPSSITLHDRDGNPSAVLEGDERPFRAGVLRVAHARPAHAGDPRGESTDFVEYVKLADGLKNIDYLSTAFIPKDIPQDIADAWRLYLVLAHSKRPVVSGAFTAWGVPRMGEIMAMFRAGREDLVEEADGDLHLLPEHAAALGRGPDRNIMDCAEWGIPIEVVPVLLLGHDLAGDHARRARAAHRRGAQRA